MPLDYTKIRKIDISDLNGYSMENLFNKIEKEMVNVMSAGKAKVIGTKMTLTEIELNKIVAKRYSRKRELVKIRQIVAFFFGRKIAKILFAIFS